MLILLGPTFQVQTDHLKGTFGRLSGTISVADVDYRANGVESVSYTHLTLPTKA